MLKEELEAEVAKRLIIENPGAVPSEQRVEEEKEQTPEPVEQETISEEPVATEPEARPAPEPEPTTKVEIAPKPETTPALCNKHGHMMTCHRPLLAIHHLLDQCLMRHLI